jgi:4-hydroxy-2-oxoheptanedioate aldolase
LRGELRERLRGGARILPRDAGGAVLGTFVKLAAADVLELCQAAGFDFVVVDLEHSTLTEAEVIALVRHADLLGLPALVRIPAVDAALINRLLENGATGIQLSMLQTAAQTAALIAATRFAPAGSRSISLANRVAGYGRTPLPDFLEAERLCPPVLVGQIESQVAEPLSEVLAGLDVAFVGTTDLAVGLGTIPGDPALAPVLADIAQAAAATGAVFGGWAPTRAAAAGLTQAGYLVVGSDLQTLATGLRSAVLPDQPAVLPAARPEDHGGQA